MKKYVQVTVIKQGSENSINANNFYMYHVLCVMPTTYHKTDFFSSYVVCTSAVACISWEGWLIIK